MHAKILAVLFSAVAVVSAIPTSGSSSDSSDSLHNVTVGPTGNAKCGNNQVVSCCDTSTTGSGDGTAIGSVLDGLLGGNCQQLNIPVLAVDVPINQACSGNQAACCTGGANGLVNVQCTGIQV